MTQDTGCAIMPTVTELGARVYVGVPVVRSDGTFFGTLCGLDPTPQDVDTDLVAWMSVLARLLAFQMDRDELLARTHAQAEELRASREWFSTTLRSIGDGVIATDARGRVALMNPAAEALTGYSEPEVRGRPHAEVFHLLDERRRGPVPSPLDLVLQERVASREPGHAVLVRRDGRMVEVDHNAAPIRDAGGQLSGAVLVVRDVSRRRAAERALEQAQARLQTVLQHAPVILLVLDAEGRIVMVEGKGLERLRLTPGETVGRSVFDLMRDVPGRLAQVRRALAGEPSSFTGELFGRVLESFYVPHRDERGGITGAIGLEVDVTERERAGQAVRQSEARFRSLVEASSQIVWTSDPSGRFETEQPGWSRFTGQSFAELGGFGWLDALHPEDRSRVISTWQDAVRARVPLYEEEFRLRRADGVFRHVAVQATPVLDPESRVREWVGMCVDVTAQREHEEAARRQEEFERQLLGIVSHDLRNPLSAIRLGAHALLRQEDLGERAVKSAARIQAAAERATRLVSDLLDLTQVRVSGGIPVARRPMDLHEVTRQVIEELQFAHPSREILLTSEGSGLIEGDPDRLAQVLTNLVANALTYSPEDTPVRVTTRGEEGLALLSVHNLGPAIPPELLPRLFEPFSRGTQRASASRSVGLGLFIVRHLVLAHGGTVDVRSSEGAGTTFSLRLPRHGGGPH